MRLFFSACLAFLAVLIGAAAQPAPSSDAVDLKRLLTSKPAPTLDAYRLFTDAGHSFNADVTPYDLNTPLFSDYALKFRAVYLPPGKAASFKDKGALDFPVGTTLIKTFAFPADFRRPTERVRLIETRLLIRRANGWTPLAYVWNTEQTQAVLKRAGARTQVRFIDAAGEAVAFSYAVPNQNQCKECHQLGRQLVPLGPKARNLNGPYPYADGPENQLAHWTRAGILKGAPEPSAVPATARWTDAAAPLADRARAYLDANCAHCHNPKASANNSGLFLEYEQTDPVARGVGRRPVAAGRGAANLDFDIVPARPDLSILVHRMESRDPGVMMPELSRALVDKDGVDLIRRYIAQMNPAP